MALAMDPLDPGWQPAAPRHGSGLRRGGSFGRSGEAGLGEGEGWVEGSNLNHGWLWWL